jgi:hypothetical protein
VYKDREKQREAVRRYYDRNRDVYRAKNDRKRARLRQMVIDAKAVPCMDCGQIFPAYVMDFDHRDAIMSGWGASTLARLAPFAG